MFWRQIPPCVLPPSRQCLSPQSGVWLLLPRQSHFQGQKLRALLKIWKVWFYSIDDDFCCYTPIWKAWFHIIDMICCYIPPNVAISWGTRLLDILSKPLLWEKGKLNIVSLLTNGQICEIQLHCWSVILDIIDNNSSERLIHGLIAIWSTKCPSKCHHIMGGSFHLSAYCLHILHWGREWTYSQR